MKPTYERDNTASSLMVLFSLAAIVTAIVLFIGVSDKPDVSAIALATSDGIIQAEAPASSSAILSTQPTADEELTTDDAVAEATPEREIIVIPTAEPTPTPEVAAAVEPTPIPDATVSVAESTGEILAAPTLPNSTGVVQGAFFTRSDENEGAEVAQNLLTLSFAEDGSGEFQGVLDITYPDGTHILLNMSGAVTWEATNPQVEETLSGAFTLDAPVAADSVRTDNAELSIPTLNGGSGSLCTTRCFGFTFPPPA